MSCACLWVPSLRTLMPSTSKQCVLVWTSPGTPVVRLSHGSSLFYNLRARKPGSFLLASAQRPCTFSVFAPAVLLPLCCGFFLYRTSLASLFIVVACCCVPTDYPIVRHALQRILFVTFQCCTDMGVSPYEAIVISPYGYQGCAAGASGNLGLVLGYCNPRDPTPVAKQEEELYVEVPPI